MRVLVFMSHGLIARNFEWVLRELARRGHRVHVALDHMDKPGVRGTNRVLEGITRDHSGFSFGSAPAREPSGISVAGRAFRLVLDFVRYFDPGYAEAGKPRARIRGRIPRVVLVVGAPLARSARLRLLLGTLLRLADEGVPVDAAVSRFVNDFRPDAVLVTPLVDPGSPQTDYVRCARKLGVPSLFPVHSWDNLTLKGGVHEAPDLVAVWNERQRDEAVRLHAVPGEHVTVTGAAAYDHWFDWAPSTSRAEFYGSAGLDPEWPFLLYLGSSRFIAPNESDFVREWSTRIRDLSSELARVQVLIRPHPLNPFVGDVPDGARLATVGVVEPADLASRSSYFDAIHHAAAVVGVLTSGMIEAAIVDRPVHTVLVPRYRDTQRSTIHFRHLLPKNGGMLIVGHGYAEHVEQLERSLRGERSARNRAFVDSFVSGHGPAGGASSRVVDAVEGLEGMRPVRQVRPLGKSVAAAALARAGWVLFRLRPARSR